LEVMDYFSIIWKRRWLIITLVLVAGISSGILSLMMTKIYEAKTRILVKDPRSSSVSFLEELGSMSKNHIANYVEILKSRTLLQETTERLGLPTDPEDESFKRLHKSIFVQPTQGTDIIEIRVESPDPAEAVRVANMLVDTFISRNLHGNRQEAQSARVFIDEQTKKVRADLEASEIKLEAFKKANNIMDPVGEAAEMVKQLASLDQQLAATQVQLDEANAKLEGIRAHLGSEKEYVTATQTINTNPIVLEYRKHLAELEMELAAASEKYTNRHPVVLSLQAQINEVKQLMSAEAAKVLESETVALNQVHQQLYQELLHVQIQRIAAEERCKALKKVINTKELSFRTLPEKEMQLARLVREKTILENTFVLLKNKDQEFRIMESIQLPDIEVIDRAIPVKDPVKPRKLLNVLVAVFLALFAGSGLAFLLEYIDTSVKSVDELEKLLDLPVLGRIPDEETNGTSKSLYNGVFRHTSSKSTGHRGWHG
jgi:succinoglycan biosynthesis transport protein ExoP